jgi:hypothetical protein
LLAVDSPKRFPWQCESWGQPVSESYLLIMAGSKPQIGWSRSALTAAVLGLYLLRYRILELGKKHHCYGVLEIQFDSKVSNVLYFQHCDVRRLEGPVNY